MASTTVSAVCQYSTSDQTLRSEQEAVALSLPVLATVPRLHGMGSSRVLALPAMQGEQG